MNRKNSTIVLAVAAAMSLLVAACDDPRPADAELASAARTVVEEMARNASQRDVAANMKYIPQTDKVVYVSKGSPVTGKEYQEGLGEFYAKHRALSHTWDKLEITPIPPNAAAYTGWATLTMETLDGRKRSERVVFTGVVARTPQGWKRILAQKAVLQDD